MSTNPLYQAGLFPPFQDIQPKHVLPALKSTLKKNRAQLKGLLSQKVYTWSNLMAPLTAMDQALHHIWAPVGHLVSVNHSDAWQNVYDQALPLLTDYGTELAHSQPLYKAMCQIAESEAFDQLSQAQQKVMTNALRDFRLAGVHLPKRQKQSIKRHEQKLSLLSSQFSKHLLQATHDWTMVLQDASALSGLPDAALQTAMQEAKSRGKAGYVLTLQMPCYLNVMRHADDRKLRQAMYRAFNTRASDQSSATKRHDNGPLMTDILQHRQALSHVLGYAHYGEMALSTRMAKDPTAVTDFLRQMIKRATPKAKRDLKTLQRFAQTHCGLTELKPWDLSYVAEQYRQQHFDFSQEAVRAYFPEPSVLTGLFALLKKIYGITLAPHHGPQRCHPAVKVFKVKDRQGQALGYLMLDLYARSSKRGGAWMNECQVRYRDDQGKLQLPVAHIVANFDPPVGRKPACLTHDEVETLFHEMGHALHHVLTQVEEPDIAGINGVPWDAVECPSQLMENWCWEPAVLKQLSSHIKTGRSMPKALMDKLLASRTFMSGLHVLRQCELALFDWTIHARAKPPSHAAMRRVLSKIRQDTGLMPTPTWNRFENSFAHIFAGGYAAGYYSYLWAEVLSADAYQAFAEAGGASAKVGRLFWQHILAMGGQEDFMALFKRFRGRAPRMQALLVSYGIGRKT